jgi:hypothetical protein
MDKMIQTIIDQIDSELNLTTNPNLNYIREKVKELNQYASDQEDNASSKVEYLESELESVRDDFSDIEFKVGSAIL